MTIVSMVEMAVACGLKTLGEAWSNIAIHHLAFTNEEYSLLVKEINAWKLNPDQTIEDWMKEHRLEFYYKDEMAKSLGCPDIKQIRR